MDNQSGGTNDSGRETAAEIARKKVLAAYGNSRSFSRSETAPFISHGFPTAKSETSTFDTYDPKNPRGASTQPRPVQTPPSAQPTRPEVTLTQQSTTQAYRFQSATPSQTQTAQHGAAPSSYKQSPIRTQVSSDDWKRYHSAWQNYYQKYYSEYYAKAAKQYVDSERLKIERETADNKRDLDGDGIRDDRELTRTHVKTETTSDLENSITANLRDTIQKKANSKFRVKGRHKKLIPILAGAFTVLFILFLQYNRLIFAPIMAYIAPSTTNDTGITAIDPTVATAVSDQNKLMIPKLNVDVPVNFGIENDTKSINHAMLNGLAHFRVPGASAFPGEIGNTVVTGHSAGDIYSNNPYKFIFSGLTRLVEGDLVYIDYNKVRYTYRVTGSKTIEPTDVQALVIETDKPMLTMITCTPLGTDRYRLLVFAEQIDPSTGNATESTPVETTNESLPANEKTALESVWDWLTGN